MLCVDPNRNWTMNCCCTQGQQTTEIKDFNKLDSNAEQLSVCGILTLTRKPFDESSLDWDDVIKKLSLALLCSLNNLSKLLLRPGTARRKDIVCVRQVSDRVHGLFVSGDITPQCLSASYSRSLMGRHRCDVEFLFPCVEDMDDDDDELDDDELDEFEDELDDTIVTDVVSMLVRMVVSAIDLELVPS